MRLRSYPLRPHWSWKETRSKRPVWRSAASRTSRGAIRRPKRRITCIDAGEALSVEGVIDVLTHQNRPPMASADSAYQDDVAPEGSPFRPLYDDRIWFSGQPIALVVAEESEIARFAASLVRVEYEKEAHVTDLHRQRDNAVA